MPKKSQTLNTGDGVGCDSIPHPAALVRWEGELGADAIPAPEECFAAMYPFTKIIRALGHGPNHRRTTAKKASRSSREIANPLTVFPDQHNYSFKSTEQIFFFLCSPSSFFSLWLRSDWKRHVCAQSSCGDGGIQGCPPPGTPGSGWTALGCLQSAKLCTGVFQGTQPCSEASQYPCATK